MNIVGLFVKNPDNQKNCGIFLGKKANFLQPIKRMHPAQKGAVMRIFQGSLNSIGHLAF